MCVSLFYFAFLGKFKVSFFVKLSIPLLLLIFMFFLIWKILEIYFFVKIQVKLGVVKYIFSDPQNLQAAVAGKYLSKNSY